MEVIKQATKRQLWYLHCLTGQDTRQLNCTKAEADQYIKLALAERQGIAETLEVGMVCPQCNEIRNHGAKFCYLCGSGLVPEEQEETESNNHEEKIGLKNYLDNEPVAQFRANGMSLTSLCDKHGRMPEAVIVQQAAKLIGHRVSKANLNKNYHVAVENCLDTATEYSGFGGRDGRFKTTDDLIEEFDRRNRKDCKAQKENKQKVR